MLRIIYFNEEGEVDYEDVIKSLNINYINSEQQLIADYNDYVNDRIMVFIHPDKIIVNYYDENHDLFNSHIKMIRNIINISIRY